MGIQQGWTGRGLRTPLEGSRGGCRAPGGKVGVVSSPTLPLIDLLELRASVIPRQPLLTKLALSPEPGCKEPRRKRLDKEIFEH